VPVTIGVRRDAKVEILRGLAAGDQVVTAGMRLSRDGQPVRVLTGAPAGADAAKAAQSKGGPAPASGVAPKSESPKGSGSS
jgi:membrane fusion protein (multidrug efflux system)